MACPIAIHKGYKDCPVDLVHGNCPERLRNFCEAGIWDAFASDAFDAVDPMYSGRWRTPGIHGTIDSAPRVLVGEHGSVVVERGRRGGKSA